jgi:RNA polymerase sigma-70 factor, ECF subfamily
MLLMSADLASLHVTNIQLESEPVVDSLHDRWTMLYDQYCVRVWRYVASIIGNDSDAIGDAVQETFISAARAFHQFDSSRGTVWAWLTGIAHSQVALYWRRVNRERIDFTSAPFEEILADTKASPAAQLDQIETSEIVRRILADMPDDSAAILVGKYCDGLTVAELVEFFGGSIEGIRSKLARARRDFRNRYERANRASITGESDD